MATTYKDQYLSKIREGASYAPASQTPVTSELNKKLEPYNLDVGTLFRQLDINATGPNPEKNAFSADAINYLKGTLLQTASEGKVLEYEDKVRDAILIASFTGRDVQTDVLPNFDRYAKQFTGIDTDKNVLQSFKDYYEANNIQKQISNLTMMLTDIPYNDVRRAGYEAMLEKAKNDYATKTADVSTKSDFWRQVAGSGNIVAQSVDQMTRVLSTEIMAFMLSGGLTLGSSAVSGIQNITNAARVGAAMKVGGTASAVQYTASTMMKAEAAEIADTLMNMRDENGNRIPLDIIKENAYRWGMISALVEMGDDFITPIGKFKIGNKTLKDTFKELKGLLQRNPAGFAGLFAGSTLLQTTQEGIQGAIRQRGINDAIKEANAKGFTSFSEDQIQDSDSDYWSTALQEFKESFIPMAATQLLTGGLTFTTARLSERMEVTSQMKTDASKYFTAQQGSVYDIGYVDTVGEQPVDIYAPKEGAEKQEQKKASPIMMTVNKNTGALVPVYKRDRQYVEYLRTNNVSAIQGIVISDDFVSKVGNTTSANNLATILGMRIGEENPVMGYDGDTIIMDTQEGVDAAASDLDTIKAEMFGNPEAVSMEKQEDGSYRLMWETDSGRERSVIIRAKNDTDEIRTTTGEGETAKTTGNVNPIRRMDTESMKGLFNSSIRKSEAQTLEDAEVEGAAQYFYSQLTGMTQDEVKAAWKNDYQSIMDRMPAGVDENTIEQGARFMPLLSAITGRSTEDILNDSKNKISLVYGGKAQKARYKSGKEGYVEGSMRTLYDKDTGVTTYEIRITDIAKDSGTALVHELMHIARAMASEERLSGFVGLKGYTSKYGGMWRSDIKETEDGRYRLGARLYDTYAEAAALVEGNEERFVQDFFEYLKTGESPSAEVATFFGALKRFLQNFRSAFADEFSEETKAAFDKLLSGEVTVQPGQTIEEAVEASEATLTDETSQWEANDYSDEEMFDEEGNPLYSLADPEKAKELDKEPVTTLRRTMVFIDGKLYSPVASMDVSGSKAEGDYVKKMSQPFEMDSWYVSDERPDKIHSYKTDRRAGTKGRVYGKVALYKDNGTMLGSVAYNPYFHAGRLFNDQFMSAYKRPNLVTVEVVFPTSELESGYRAEYAYDSVGKHDWKAGMVSDVITSWTGERVPLYMSRYMKITRIVPDSEVAKEIKESLNGLPIPYEVVTPSLRSELEKLGVDVVSLKDYNKKYSKGGTDLRYGQPYPSESLYSLVSDQYEETANKYRDTDQWLKAPNGKPTNLTEQQWVMVRTPAFINWFGDWINDPENASKVVDENGEPLVVYHGSKNYGFAVFSPQNSESSFGDYKFGNAFVAYFATDKMSARSFTGKWSEAEIYNVFLNIRNPYVVNNLAEKGERNSFNIKDKTLRDYQLAQFEALKDKWEYRKFRSTDIEEINDDLRVFGMFVVPRGDGDFDVVKRGNNSMFGADRTITYGSNNELEDDNWEDIWNEIYSEEYPDDYYLSTDDVVNIVLAMNREGTAYDGIYIEDVFDSSSFGGENSDYIAIESPTQIKSATENNGDFSSENDSILYSLANDKQWQVMDANTQRRIDADYDYVYNQYFGTDKWMKAPNGQPTKLTERQWVQVRTPAFKEWFGDWENDPENASKVVDENGEPLVEFHGTMSYGFDTFRVTSYAEFGAHFGTRTTAEIILDQQNAGDLWDFENDGDPIYQVFLNIRNPIENVGDVFVAPWGFVGVMEERGMLVGEEGQSIKALADQIEEIDDRRAVAGLSTELSEKINSYLKRLGYDGVKYTNGFEEVGSTSWIALSPNQIKSATDNSGAFSVEDDSILYSIATDEEYQNALKSGEIHINADGSMTFSGEWAELVRTLDKGLRGTYDQKTKTVKVRPSFVKRVIAAITGKHRVTGSNVSARYFKDSEGKIVGAPLKYNTPEKLMRLKTILTQLANEGAYGRFWYEESSRAILDAVGGDVNEARKFAAVLAILSPQMKVDANTSIALKAWAQYKAGVPIDVKTGAQNKALNNLLYNGIEWEGQKTNNFFINLMREIDPTSKEAQGVTVDMWMMRAFGYDNDAPTDAQYQFVEKITHQLADKLGWEPQQVQAAIWVALKKRTEDADVKAETEAKSQKKGFMHYEERTDEDGKVKKVRVIDDEVKHRQLWLKTAMSKTIDEISKASHDNAGFNYATGLMRNIGQISVEAAPSKTSGVLPGYYTASPELKAQYFKDVFNVFLDENGNDELNKLCGLLTLGSVEAPGVWEGDVSLGLQQLIAIPTTVVDGQKVVTEEAKLALDTKCALLGYFLCQDGVAWNKAVKAKNLTNANGVDLDIKRVLTDEEALSLANAIDKAGAGKLSSNDVIMVSNPHGMYLANGTVWGDNPVANKEFCDIIKTSLEQWDADVEYDANPYHHESNLIENDWKGQPNGEGYISWCRRNGRLDVLRAAQDRYSEDIRRIRQRYSETYGWGSPGSQFTSNESGEINDQSTESLYSLSPERQAEVLQQRKAEIQRAVASDIFIRTEFLEEFRGEEWADAELELRDFMVANPDVVTLARNSDSLKEFKDRYFKKNKKKDQQQNLDFEDIPFDEPEDFETEVETAEAPETEDTLSDTWFEKIFDYAHTLSSQDRDRQFAAEWTATEDKTLELAKALRGYMDAIFNPRTKSRSGGYWTTKYVYNSFKGVSNKVRMLQDGKKYNQERSTSEQIQEAQKLIRQNPRPYRNAYQLAMMGESRAAEAKSGENVGMAADWMRLEAIDDDIAQEMEKLEAEDEKARRLKTDYKAKYEDIKQKLRDAEKDLAKNKESARTKISDLNDYLIIARRKIDELNSQIKENEKDLKSAEREYSKLIEKLGGKIEDLQEENAELRGYRKQAKQLEKQLQDRRARVEELRSQLTDAHAEERRLSNALNALRRWKEAKEAADYRKKRIKQILKLANFNSGSVDASFEDSFLWVQNLFERDEEVMLERKSIDERIADLKTRIDTARAQGENVDQMQQDLLTLRKQKKESRRLEPPAQLAIYLPADYLVRADNRQSVWTAEELDVLHAAVKKMRADAKQMLETKENARMARLMGFAYDYFRQMVGRPADLNLEGEMSSYALGRDIAENLAEGQESGAFNTFRFWNAKLQRLARILDNNKEGLLYDWFVRENYRHQSDELAGIRTRLEAGEKKWKELGLKGRDLAKEGYSGTKENGTEYSLTRGQMIGVYIYSKSELGMEKLTHYNGNDLSEADIKDIVAELTPTEIEWADFMLADMQANYQRLADVYYRGWNMILGQRENYFTLVPSSAATESQLADGIDPQGDIVGKDNKAYVNKDFTKNVNPNAIYPLDLDVTRTWNWQVRKQEHFIAYGEWAKDSQYLFAHDGGQISNVMERTVGKTQAKYFKKIVDNVIGSQQTQNDFDKTYTKWLARRNSGVLIGNTGTMLKQGPSWFAAFNGDVDVTEALKNAVAINATFREFMVQHPEIASEFFGIDKAYDFIWANAPEMKDRQIDMDIMEQLNRMDGNKFTYLFNPANRAISKWTMGLVDKLVVNNLWMSRYYTVFNQQKEAGKTDMQAHTEAAFKASQFISETQPTSMRMDQSSSQIDAKSSAFLRSIMIFTNQVVNSYNQLYLDVPMAFRQKNWKKAVSVIASTTFMIGMAAVLSGKFVRRGDEDDKKYAWRLARELLSTAISASAPGFGSIVSTVMEYDSDYNTYVFGLDTIASAVKKVLTPSERKTALERIGSALEELGIEAGYAIGAPVTPVKNVVKSIKNENAAYLLNGAWGQIVESYK